MKRNIVTGNVCKIDTDTEFRIEHIKRNSTTELALISGFSH